MNHSQPRFSSSSGFTLVELLIATTILGLVTVGVLRVVIEALKLTTHGTFRLETNADLRKLTDELDSNATRANYFLIFSDFSTTTTSTGTTTSLANLSAGSSGDFLLLVFKDPADDTKVQQLIGYYRNPTTTVAGISSGQVGYLYKFSVTVSPSSNAGLWTLMPGASTLTTNTAMMKNNTATVTNSFSGENSNGKMFYNFLNRSIMIKTQVIFTEAANQSPRTASTYNFTVSPRG